MKDIVLGNPVSSAIKSKTESFAFDIVFASVNTEVWNTVANQVWQPVLEIVDHQVRRHVIKQSDLS